MKEVEFIFQSLKSIDEIVNNSKISLDANFLKLDYWVMVALFNLFCDRKLITDDFHSHPLYSDLPSNVKLTVERRVIFSGLESRYGDYVPDSFLREISIGSCKKESLLDLNVLDKTLLREALKKLQDFWFERFKKYDDRILDFLRLSVKEFQIINPIKEIDDFKLLLMTPPENPISKRIFEELLSKGFILRIAKEEVLIKKYTIRKGDDYRVKNKYDMRKEEQFFMSVIDDSFYEKLCHQDNLGTLKNNTKSNLQVMNVLNKGNEFYIVFNSKNSKKCYYLNLNLEAKKILEIKLTSISLEEKKKKDLKILNLNFRGMFYLV